MRKAQRTGIEFTLLLFRCHTILNSLGRLVETDTLCNMRGLIICGKLSISVPFFVAYKFDVFKDRGAAELVSNFSGSLHLSCCFCKSHTSIYPHAGT